MTTKLVVGYGGKDDQESSLGPVEFEMPTRPLLDVE